MIFHHEKNQFQLKSNRWALLWCQRLPNFFLQRECRPRFVHGSVLSFGWGRRDMATTLLSVSASVTTAAILSGVGGSEACPYLSHHGPDAYLDTPVSCSLSAASALRTLFVPRVLEPVFACPSSIVVGSLGIVRYFWILLFEVRLYNVIDNDDIKGTVGYLHLSNECTYNVPFRLLEFFRCSPKK